ncbi:hypothetical protein [Streptomyces sp. NPDC051662]|uniref:hypothetical protein n=1 Tax=Streptomyces sp. NPDC051662 TaxID=3154750 RepID=UPI003418EFD1
MFTTIVAVLGTLLGVVVTGVFQARTTSRADIQAREAELRRERLAAITDLADTITAHRIAMYRRGDARLKGRSDDHVEELRAISHDTRREVTPPLTRLRVLIQDPAVREAADAMVTATYGMRRSDGTTDATLTLAGLTAARQAAVDAHDAFVDAAAHYLAA